jgi:hypothetical protein
MYRLLLLRDYVSGRRDNYNLKGGGRCGCVFAVLNGAEIEGTLFEGVGRVHACVCY